MRRVLQYHDHMALPLFSVQRVRQQMQGNLLPHFKFLRLQYDRGDRTNKLNSSKEKRDKKNSSGKVRIKNMRMSSNQISTILSKAN